MRDEPSFYSWDGLGKVLAAQQDHDAAVDAMEASLAAREPGPKDHHDPTWMLLRIVLSLIADERMEVAVVRYNEALATLQEFETDPIRPYQQTLIWNTLWDVKAKLETALANTP